MRRAGLVFGGVWLVILIEPIGDLFHRGSQTWRVALGLAIILVFVAVYLVTLRTPFAGRPGSRPVRFVPYLLLALAVAWLPFAGAAGLTAFVFVTVSMQANLALGEAALGTLAVVVGLAVLPQLTPGWDGVNSSYAVSAGAAALAMFGVARLADRNRELRDAQSELARLAVVDERERFARDMHDILGHTLTVVTIKAQLAGKLVERDPEAARREIDDIERLAREALTDVRATVGGYREISLVGELSAARIALHAAGIQADLPGAVDSVPGERRELYGWVVREGVTNVVRHSGATRCSVRLLENGIEIVDDGATAAPVPARLAQAGEDQAGQDQAGQGIRGLRQRVADAGGRLEIGPLAGGGFRLGVLL